MGVWIAEAVMIQYLEQFGFFECGNCLTRFVVIHQDDLQSRRVEDFALICNANINTMFIHDPVIVEFIPQDFIERIADVRAGYILGDGDISGIPAWRRHHFAHGGIAGSRTKCVGEIFEHAHPVDDSIWFAIFADNGGNAACFAGESPCETELCIRTDGVEAARDRFKTRRCIRQQDGGFQSQGF